MLQQAGDLMGGRLAEDKRIPSWMTLNQRRMRATPIPLHRLPLGGYAFALTHLRLSREHPRSGFASPPEGRGRREMTVKTKNEGCLTMSWVWRIET